MAWLGEVRDVRLSIDATHPLLVRSREVRAAGKRRQATVPHPERHPYCELGLLIEGKAVQFVGSQKTNLLPGSIFLIGPGIPHYGFHLEFPFRVITVHFLPSLLLEMGPDRDGSLILSRFAISHERQKAVLRTPAALRRDVGSLFRMMAKEYLGTQVGSEVRLRSILIEILVRLLRWEGPREKNIGFPDRQPHWAHLKKAIQYIKDNYASPLYVLEIAAASGLSSSQLQLEFRRALGVSCMQYLCEYRITQSKTLLCMHEMRVGEAAMAVGFETLSHFNSSFRRIVGMSPTEYVQSQEK